MPWALYNHFQENYPKACDSKNYLALNELFNYQQIKLDEKTRKKHPGTRKKLLVVDIVYLEDLGIIYVRYKNQRLVFIDLFVNSVYTRHQFNIVYF